MVIRNTGKKVLSGNDYALCYYCTKKTQYLMEEPDRSEYYCCEDCLWARGNIRKFSPSKLQNHIKRIKGENRSSFTRKKNIKKDVVA